MTARWWHEDELPPAKLLERWLTPAPPPTPPATLRHLAPALRADAPQTHLPPPLAPASARRPAARLDSPVGQCGFVRRWRASAVDLRALLYPPAPVEGKSGEQGDAGEPAGIAKEISLARLRRQALARRLLVTLQPSAAVLLRGGGPLAWPMPLFPYQHTGIQALLQAPALLLGDEMGLGKTVQALAALRLLFLRRAIRRALIVAPASLLLQWQGEIARWAPELRVMTILGVAADRQWQWRYRAHVTLVSYETLRADARAAVGERWHVVVLDEAQKIKNRASAVAQVCKRLPRERAWALTGTPLENRTDDVASILEFVTGQPAPNEGPALRAALNQYQLRRRKVDVLRDLPPKLVTDLRLPMPPAQRRAYDRAAYEGIVALRALEEVRVEHVLALITRLKQLCNFAPGGESAKMDDLRQRIEELTADGYRALVFTQYVDDTYGARRIAAGLHRFAPLVFTGELSLPARREVIERFRQGGHSVLILSLRAGGLGLNLQSASYVFHFDRWWNPAVEQQAEDRTHRIGQTLPVHVYRYQLTDTIEERIQQLIQRKIDLFTNLIDTTSMDLSQLVTQDDLFGLLDME